MSRGCRRRARARRGFALPIRRVGGRRAHDHRHREGGQSAAGRGGDGAHDRQRRAQRRTLTLPLRRRPRLRSPPGRAAPAGGQAQRDARLASASSSARARASPPCSSGRRATVFTLAVAPLTSATGVKLDATGARLASGATKTIQRRLKVKLPRARSPPSPPPAPSRRRRRRPPARAARRHRRRPAARARLRRATGQARPAGARTITGATVTWRRARVVHPLHRERRGHHALARGRRRAPEALEGAPPLVYGFRFPFAEGWCDPATGAARVTFTGTVAFRYAAHGIDLVVNDPEVELDGPNSRVIFRMTGSGDTAGGNQRQVVETLDVSKATATGGGNAFAYERIPGAVPPGAAGSVFAGYYLPGDPFGSVSLSYTTD